MKTASIVLVGLILCGCTELEDMSDGGGSDAAADAGTLSDASQDGGGPLDDGSTPPDDGSVFDGGASTDGGCAVGTFGTATFGTTCFGD